MFLNPIRLLDTFHINRGDYIADFGAGHGYFAIPMAERVGGDGRIFALDINRHAIDIIRRDAKYRHLLNICPIWTDIEKPHGSSLKKNFIDAVLAANVLHQCADTNAVFQETARILHENGRLLLVDWLPDANVGPDRELRVGPREAEAAARAAGLALTDEIDAGRYHYALEFRKQALDANISTLKITNA